MVIMPLAELLGPFALEKTSESTTGMLTCTGALMRGGGVRTKGELLHDNQLPALMTVEPEDIIWGLSLT